MNPRNRRLRAAMFVQRMDAGGVTTVAIDTGPDFRAQCLASEVQMVHGAVYTHAHADHIHGIDDLRTFVLVSRKRMPIWADDETFARLEEAFGYCFATPAGSSYPPICERHTIADGSFSVDGPGGAITFEPLRQHHGDGTSLGFRVGSVAYCSDVSGFPRETLERLRGLDTLIVDALQYRSHPSHFSVSEALEIVEALKPRRTLLTHMHTPLDYEALAAELPDGVEPAYDGLTFETAEVAHPHVP